jgi:hypothetical protein
MLRGTGMHCEVGMEKITQYKTLREYNKFVAFAMLIFKAFSAVCSVKSCHSPMCLPVARRPVKYTV